MTKDGNMEGNLMETISLKALSYKVLERNLKGNSMETEPKKQGNFEAKKEGGMFPCFHDGNRTETDIKKMPLSDFEQAGLTLKIWSEVLQDHVFFVSNEETITRHKLDLVAYSAPELNKMLDMEPEAVRAAHSVKSIFHRARVIKHRANHGQL